MPDIIKSPAQYDADIRQIRYIGQVSLRFPVMSSIRHHLLGWICLLFPAFLVAQDGTIKIGLLLGPERSSPSTYLFTYPDGKIQYMETAKSTFSGGILTQYWLNHTITLRLGILYTDKGYKQVLLDGDGNPQGDATKYRFSYLSLPVTAKMPLNPGPAYAYLNSGLSVDIFLHGYGGERSFSEDTFNQVSMSFVLGAGFEFPFTAKLRGFVEPHFRLAITDYTLERRYRPFSLGIALGFLYR